MSRRCFQKRNEDASAPVVEILVIASGNVPGLVKVTDCEAVDWPKSSLPNAKLLADNVGAGLTPVPLKVKAIRNWRPKQV